MSNYLTLPLVCFAPSLYAKFHAKYAGILCLLYMIIIGMKFPLCTVLSDKFFINKQEDMMDVLRYDVAKPLARLAERENSHSRSSSRASMASRGHVRNDDYKPLCYCPPPRFESKGKELVYS